MRLHFTSRYLIAAASEAKKNALMAKYGLGKEDVDKAADADPTPNGQYTEWVCREMSNGGWPKGTSFSQGTGEVIARYLNDFSKLKISPEFQEECRINENRFMDIMKYSAWGFRLAVEQSKKLVSKNQQKKQLEAASLLWTGEFEGHKIEVFAFGAGDGEAYAHVSGGPSLSSNLTPAPETSWCTVELETAMDYLEEGDAYIIRVDEKNYCNIHEESTQCNDANNRPMYRNKLVYVPVVLFAIEKAPIPLTYFRAGRARPVAVCHQCNTESGDMVDTRYGYEGSKLCEKCFIKDWRSEIKRYIMELYNANPGRFKNEPTPSFLFTWESRLWMLEYKEQEHNFWTIEDVEKALDDCGVFQSAAKEASFNPNSILAAVQG